MKFTLTLHLQAAQLNIESERLDDLAKGYLMARELGANGNLPAGYDYVPDYDGPLTVGTTPVDDGVVREASQEPIEPVTAERETEKPGKTPRARKAAEPKTEPETSPPPAEPEPAPKNETAAVVTRDVAQAKLGDLLRDKGAEPVAALLKRFGVARFGLYVANDYAEFCAAIDEAAQ